MTEATPRDIDRFEPAEERGPIEGFDFNSDRYVFISYLSGIDPDLLRAIVRCLLRRRVGVWMCKPGPCRLNNNEIRGVRSQAQDEAARPEVGWPEVALDAMDRAVSVLLLLGQDSNKHQNLEIDHAIKTRGGKFHVARTDGIADEQMPDALHKKSNYKLNPAVCEADVIAGEIKQLTDNIASEVLGDDYRPVVTRKQIKPKGIVSDGRLGLIAATTLVVAIGGGAAVLWWPRPEPPPAPPVQEAAIDPTAVPVNGSRLALVITQANYNGRTIRRVEKATDEGAHITRALDTLQFDITPVVNATKAELDVALKAFRDKLKAAGPDAVAFIYYTGHGIQHPQHPDNFLLGTDTNLNTEKDIETFGVSLTAQRDLFHAVGARGVVMVFDACRNIPPDFKDVLSPPSFEPATKGMVRMKAPVGMLVAYSTDEGDVAEEGAYAPILAEELLKPGRTIEQAFESTKYRVADKSGRIQRPWDDAKIYEKLCLSCPTASGAPG